MAENIQLPPLPSLEDLPKNTSTGDALLIFSWVLLGISTALLLGRLISKIYVLRQFRLDDICLILTWATSVAYTASLQLSYHWGLGRHSIYLGVFKSIELIRWAYVCQVFCVVTPLLGRLAVTIYTLNLLGRAKPWVKYSLVVLAVVQLITNLSLLVALLSICGVDMTVVANPATTCYKQSPQSIYAESVSAFNGFTDAALAIAPLYLIWSLRTTTRAKIAASFLLGFSLLAMGASIWRTVELKVIFNADWDFTRNSVPYWYASSFEQASIMIAASIPTLGPVFKQVKSEAYTKGSPVAKNSITNISDTTTTSERFKEDASGRPFGSEDAQIQLEKNFAHALGIQMPGLGNTTEISGGAVKSRSRFRRRSSSGGGGGGGGGMPMPMPLSKIKTTTKTDVKVESAASSARSPVYTFYKGEDDVESLLDR